MADYYTKFSCEFDTGSAEGADRAIRLYLAWERYLETLGETVCFMVEHDPTDDAPGTIWIHDGDGSGDPDQVIEYIIRLARRLRITGHWGFAWCHDCSGPKLDAYGGGACILDLASGSVAAETCTTDWLETMLSRNARFVIRSASEGRDGKPAFWSNDHGWTIREMATVFTDPPAREFHLPASAGQDAEWIEIGTRTDHAPASNGGFLLQSAASEPNLEFGS